RRERSFAASASRLSSSMKFKIAIDRYGLFGDKRPDGMKFGEPTTFMQNLTSKFRPPESAEGRPSKSPNQNARACCGFSRQQLSKIGIRKRSGHIQSS